MSAFTEETCIYTVIHHFRLEALEEELNTDCTSHMSLAGVGEGHYCVARFPLDSRWYRGLVVTVERYQSEVFFLDHGDTEWVPNNMVQPIDPSLLNFPFQAIECSLKADGVTWSPEAGDLLWEWTTEQVLLAKVVDTCSSKLLECTHHVIELHLSGDSMTQRLPRVGPLLEPLTKKEEPSPGSPLGPHISALLSFKGEDRVHVAMETQSVVVKNPRVRVTPEEVTSMCQLVPQVTEPTCIFLLRTLSCLAAFQQGVCECLAEEQCLKHIVPMIKSHSLQVLELEFILLRMLLPNAHSHEVLCSRECVTSLCSCLRRKPSMKIVGHILDILSVILEEDRRLCKDVCEAGCIPQLCQLFSQSPTLHSSCLRILVAIVTKMEGVTEVRKHLPINSLCKLLNSEPEVQVVRSVVQILQSLCADSSYRQQLLSSPLPRAIQQLSHNSAINCLLLQDFSALDLLSSASTCDSPPPLIYDGMEDTTSVHSAAPTASVLSPSVNAANMKEHVAHPRVLWSQSRSHVLLAVQLRGCKQKEVKLGSRSVELWAFVPPQNYGFSLTLYKDIDPQACSDKVMGSEVLIRLAKIQHVLWPRLTELKQKPAFVSVDFDRWNDSSSEVEAEDPDIAKSKKSVHVRKQLPNKPQLYKDFLLPEQDTSSSSEDSSSDLNI